MADPLLAKLDRLMRQMERGQLLDDELNIDEIDGGVENGRRAPRRRRRAKKFKNWDNGTTSSRLPEYDALRDPHCRYTKQRQFKQQWEQFSKAAMIQEVLRGDHASLLDVLHRKKKVKGTKGRSPRANLTDRSEYSLDGRPKKKTRRRGRKRRGVKASTNVGSNNTSGGLPRVRQARGRQKHATALANRIYGAPGGSPSAPSRGDFSMDIPTLPPMFSKEMLRGGISKRRIKNVNESWKRTGATSSVNAAVLRYRTKQNQSSSKLARNAKIFHGDRVEQEYKRAKNITKSYSKKAKMAALREKALLPPLPDSNNFSPRGMAGHRHREKYGNKVMNDPTSNSMQLQESHLKSVENVNPEKLLQDSPVKDCVTENKGDILRKSTPPSRSIKAGTNSIPNLNRDQAPESSNSPPDSPTGYSDDDYEEDDDFENDDFEEEDETNDSKTIESGEQTRENSDPQNVEKRTTEKVISPQQEQRRIQKMYQKQAEEVAVTLDHDDSESHPIEVTIQDMSKNVSSQLRGCESLLHKLIFTKDENGSTTREDIMSLLSELNTSYFESGTGISKIDSVKDAVSETLSDVFARTSDSRRKALTITRCIRAVSRAANFALAEAAAAIDSAADSTESDAASQKKALTKVFAGDIVVKGFAAARLPLIIAQGILKTHAKTQECDATICESLDRILMATGLGFLRNEADASGRERYENFVGIIDSKLSLHSNSRLLYHYGPLLSAATKGIVSVLIWQSSHGGSEGDGTQRLRFAIARDSALEESYSWALDNHSNICWVPKAYTNGDPWNKRLSAQLLFPYFKRKKNAEKNDGSMLERGLEEGEGSGPRKEFFALVGSQLVKKSISAFVYVKSVESLWISPSETSNASLLRWIGYLMGCAFTSRCNLGVLMPKYIFIALLTPRKSELPDVDLAGLSEINPELCEGLHNLSRMSETDFAQLLEMEGFDRSMSRAEVSVCTNFQCSWILLHFYHPTNFLCTFLLLYLFNFQNYSTYVKTCVIVLLIQLESH